MEQEKILIKNAIKIKEYYLYYIDGKGHLCMARMGFRLSDKEFDLEVKKAKYYYKKNAKRERKEK